MPDQNADNSENIQELTEIVVDKVVRTGGTFLHTSRTRPSHLSLSNVPVYLSEKYTEPVNDITPDILKNIEFLGIDFLIAIGGDDTLSYAQRLHEEGIKVVASQKKVVDIHKYYNAERLRPKYKVFDGKSMYVMTSDV